MLGPGFSARVFAYGSPCDMRKSYEGLHAIVRNDIGDEILDGDLYLFTNRRRNRAKVLFFDGTGLCIFMKRMSSGKFKHWPSGDEKLEGLEAHELLILLRGGDPLGIETAPIWRRVQKSN